MQCDQFSLIPGREPGTYLIDEYTGGPDAVIPCGVCQISRWNWVRLRSLVVAPTVRLIKPYAFTEMRSLRRLVLPDSIEILSAKSFLDCTGLREVEVSAHFIEHMWVYCGHEIKRGICLTYLRRLALEAQRCPRLDNYIVKHHRVLIEIILEEDDAPALTGLLQCIPLPKPTALDEFQALATGTATTTVLMAWRGTHYTQQELERAREEHTAKLLGEKPFSVADWRATLRFSIRNGVATIIGCREGLAELTIPARIGRNSVRITPGAFASLRALRTVYIEDGIEEIPERAFARCGQITEIILPPSVRRIGSQAFGWCMHLPVLHAQQVESIGENAFYRCMALKEVELGDQLKFMEACVFYACNQLAHIRLPGSLRDVPPYALLYCKRLETAVIEEGIERIEHHAFAGCRSLRSVSLPESLRQIDSQAFTLCFSLPEVRIPKGVTAIAPDAFGTRPTKRTGLIVTAGSYAETYARENNMRYTIE